MNTVHPGSTNDHHLDPERSLALRRAAKASFIGNFIEWFDYASYTVPGIGHRNRLLPRGRQICPASGGICGVRYVVHSRPIGAIVWGAWGDRWGRRWALSWSILIMSGSTFLIGLLPPHSAIGILGAIGLLLLRVIQGFSASGEYAGAGTFLAEYSPPSQRGIYTSLVPASTACGLLAGSLTATGMFSMLSDSAVNTWGWRIPFLLSGPLGLIGRYIRVHLEDSPAYQEMRAEMPQEQKSAGWSEPLRLLFRDHRHETLITFGVSCLNAVAFYMLLTYMPTYAHQELGFSQDTANFATSVTLVCYIVSIFLMGHMSDSFGRRRMLISACIAFIVVSIPLFVVMTKATTLMVVILCQIVFAIVLTANDGTLATFLAESFPTNVRYSGFACHSMVPTRFSGARHHLFSPGLSKCPAPPSHQRSISL